MSTALNFSNTLLFLGLISLSACAPAGGTITSSSDPASSSGNSSSSLSPAPTPSETSGGGTVASGGNAKGGSTRGPASPPTPTLSAKPAPTPVVARPSSAGNERVCAGSITVKGIDVSDYDHGTQWSSVAHGGAGFVYIKATEGTSFINTLFPGDWATAAGVGLIRGPYHFYHASQDPTAQAKSFLAEVGTLAATDLPAMLDWEVTDGASASTQVKNAQIWLDLVEKATGKTPIIYTDPGFWNSIGNPTQFARYPLYIANYGATCPDVPPPWSQWVIWQTGIGPYPGIQSGQADLDEFNGTGAQLLQFASGVK